MGVIGGGGHYGCKWGGGGTMGVIGGGDTIGVIWGDTIYVA